MDGQGEGYGVEKTRFCHHIAIPSIHQLRIVHDKGRRKPPNDFVHNVVFACALGKFQVFECTFAFTKFDQEFVGDDRRSEFVKRVGGGEFTRLDVQSGRGETVKFHHHVIWILLTASWRIRGLLDIIPVEMPTFLVDFGSCRRANGTLSWARVR